MRPRIHYTESQKVLMWERWQKGESLQQIAQLFDRNHSSIQGILAATGGIRPAPRSRSRWALTLAEREEISRAVVAGHSMRSIAAQLGRVPSTISREIKRNGGQEGYRASRADQAAWDRGRRPKAGKLAANRVLARLVAGKLRRQWSPAQIAGWLKRTYPDDTSRQVSPETIYRSLFIQARGALKKELVAHLRRRRVMRRSRLTPEHGRPRPHRRRRLDQRASRHRRRPGGAGSLGRRPVVRHANSHLVTLVERQSRYVMLVKVAGNRDRHRRADQARADPTGPALPVADVGPRQRDGRSQAVHPGDRRHGLLLRPSESLAARHQREHQPAPEAVLPQGHRPLGYSQAKLNAVARRLNERPRKTLNFETPAERFHQTVASIG